MQQTEGSVSDPIKYITDRRKRFRPHKVYRAEGSVSDPIKYIYKNTGFVGKYVTGRRKRLTPYSISYIFLIRITSRVDLIMSVCPSVRPFLRNMSVSPSVRINAEISETMGATLLRFGVQIPELLTQRFWRTDS